MKFICIIPARGGSKRFPNKNIALLNGKPLVSYPITSAINAGISCVFVSTDSKEIADVAKGYGAKIPGLRPLRLSGDSSPVIDTIKYVAESVAEDFTHIVLLQPTNPFINSEYIKAGINLISKSKADSVVAVYPVSNIEHPFNVRHENSEGYLSFCNEELHNLKDKPVIYKAAGMWIFSKALLMFENKIEGKSNLGLKIDFPDFIDIDYEHDLKLAEVWIRYNLK